MSDSIRHRDFHIYDEDGIEIHPDFSDPGVLMDCLLWGPLLSGIFMFCLYVVIILFMAFPFLAIIVAICAIILNSQCHSDTESGFTSNHPRNYYRVDKNGGMNYFRLHGYDETPPPVQKQTEPHGGKK
jgi:hypothetical protein